MKTLDDITVEGRMRILLWAPPGAGKTALAATFPGVAFIDTDHGLKTLKSKWFREFNDGPPDLVGFETFDDEYDRYGVFKPQPKGFWDALDFINKTSSDERIKTYALDSISTFQVLAMHVGIEASGIAKRSKTYVTAKTTHALLPTQADFGAEMNVFEQFMNQFIKLDKNIICIAHEMEKTTDSGALLRREPYLIGSSIRAQVAKWFDEVWYLETASKGVRKLNTQADNIFKVNKSRLGVPDGLENPTYKKIMEAIA